MLIKLFKYRLLFLLASTFFLCQCTKVVNSSEPTVTVNKKYANPYKIPTAAYLAEATHQDGEKKQKLLLLAAGSLIADGNWRQGLTILAQTTSLTVAQENEKKLLLAQVALVRNKPKFALAKLAEINKSEVLTPYHQVKFHEYLAQSYRSTGMYIEAVSERIKLESLMADVDSQIENRRQLWLALINIPVADLTVLSAETNRKSALQGWIQLVLISHQYRNNSKSLLAALDQWQSNFSGHPANQMLPNPLDSIAEKMIIQPKKIALLVPLSGSLSGPGNAIREGFIAAHKASAKDNDIHISLYDTEKEDIVDVYEKAVSDGANYIVGPLTKNQVAIVASMNHSVPTLLLNDTDVDSQNNSYVFGLSPVNEARQVAIKARNKGYSKALIIAPSNDWGKDISGAFVEQWQQKGGKVIDTFSYNANDDLNKKMRDLLRITDSESREKQLNVLLGQHIEFLPGRRQDFDMIFLLAYPSKARQIMPLLKYYYAGDVPVYATSSVYSGSINVLKDKDLDGIIFCDIPWVFSHQMGSRNWPEQFNSYNRLYALGMDSYSLATQLNQLILFSADGSKETNGTLYLQSPKQVARVLEWGQFKQGLAHSMGDTV